MALTQRDTPSGHYDRSGGLIAVSVLFSILIIIIVGLRFLREVKIRRFGIDDGLLVVATLLSLASNSITIAAAIFGDGKHVYDIHNPTDLFHALQLPWIGQPLSTFALLFSKASIGATLLTLGLGRTFKYFILLVILISTFGNAWSGIAVVSGCNPVAHLGSGSPCRPSASANVASYFQGAANILTDFAFLFAPEVALRAVKLSRRDRMAIRILLSFILLATIMSILKLVYLIILLKSQDVTWASAIVSQFGIAETNLTIIAACLPAIRQLCGKYFPKSWRFWRRPGGPKKTGDGMDHPISRETDTELSHPRPLHSRSQHPDSIKLAHTSASSIPRGKTPESFEFEGSTVVSESRLSGAYREPAWPIYGSASGENKAEARTNVTPI